MTARRTLTPAPANRSEAELRARLAVLDAEIAAAPGWGAAVGAMDEERREIKGALARLTLKPNVERDPARAAAIAELHRAQASIDRAREHLMGPQQSAVLPSAPASAPMPAVKPTLGARPPPRGPTPTYVSSVAPLPNFRTARKWPWQREFWR